MEHTTANPPPLSASSRDLLAVLAGLPVDTVTLELAALATGLDASKLHQPVHELSNAGPLMSTAADNRFRLASWVWGAHIDPPDPHSHAWQAVLTYYLRSAQAAADQLAPHRASQPPGMASPLRSQVEASCWYREEWVNLITLIRSVAGVGDRACTVALAHAVWPGWWCHGLPGMGEAARLSLLAARAGHDEDLLANTLTLSCHTTRHQGQLGESLRHARELLSLRRETAEAWLQHAATLVAAEAAEPALASAHHACELARDAGEAERIHRAYCIIADAQSILGAHHDAVVTARHALDLLTPPRMVLERPRTLRLLARVLRAAGQRAQAKTVLREALEALPPMYQAS